MKLLEFLEKHGDILFRGYWCGGAADSPKKRKGRSDPKPLDYTLKNFPWLLGALHPHIVLVDYDTKEAFDCRVQIAQALEQHCIAVRSSRGGHMYFYDTAHMVRTANAHNRTLLSFYPVDYKMGYKVTKSTGEVKQADGYACLSKEDKSLRELVYCSIREDGALDEIPFYDLRVKAGEKYDFLGMKEGDGRNELLHSYMIAVKASGFTYGQYLEGMGIVNAHIMKDPIPADEFETVTRKDEWDSIEYGDSGKSSHSDLAKEIIGRFNLITVNGDFYNYENGVYKPFPNGKITHYLTEHYPKLNANFEREVIRHISGLTYTEPPKDDGTVNVKNGVLSFSPDGTVVLLPHTMEHISFKQFNATYNPKAQSKLLDDTLLLWFNGSSKQIELFNQLLGYLLMNHVNYQKVFFFMGAPSTGKTTLLKLIICFCGNENVSAIQLEDMGKPFGLASIVNKIANVFSDIRKTRVLASETFKMLADGSPLQINRKFRQEFTYCYTGKLLFGMNSYPDFSKDFDGIERRVVIFEFKHVFRKGDPQFNPAILESLTSDECMSALLNRAISGYKSLTDNKGFIETKESRAALEDFVSDNDSVVKWLRECGIDEDYLLREPIKMGSKGLYREYQEFCLGAGEEAKAQKDFSRTICNKYGFRTRTKRINGERPQVFVKK